MMKLSIRLLAFYLILLDLDSSKPRIGTCKVLLDHKMSTRAQRIYARFFRLEISDIM